MADKRISQLDDATALAGGEAIPVVQAGQTRKATPVQIVAAASMQSVDDRTAGRVVTVDHIDAVVANQIEQQVIRANTSAITVDFTLDSWYNALSAGPITINEGAAVSVMPNSHWSIV